MSSNKQVEQISWNCHLSYNSDWKSLDDVIEHMRGIFSRYDIKYCCYAKEFGKQGVTPHIQGYTIFTRRYAYNKLFKDWHVNNKVFIQETKKSETANFIYIAKEGVEFHEFGTRPKIQEGEKNQKVDVGELIRLARLGQMDKIVELSPSLYLRQRSAFERLAHEAVRPVPFVKSNLWLVGSSGAGKSWFANQFNANSCYNKPPSKWWCGYTDQETVIIDDIDRSNAAALGYNLKIWGDRYNILAEVKGGSVYLKHKNIIVTSNYRINDLYEDHDLRMALHRRYKEIEVFEVRETPIGSIEIKTRDPNHPMLFKWLNNTNIFD